MNEEFCKCGHGRREHCLVGWTTCDACDCKVFQPSEPSQIPPQEEQTKDIKDGMEAEDRNYAEGKLIARSRNHLKDIAETAAKKEDPIRYIGARAEIEKRIKDLNKPKFCTKYGCNGAPQIWKDALISRFSKDINYLESHIGSDIRIELPAFVETLIAEKDEAIEKLGKLYAEKCSELASAESRMLEKAVEVVEKYAVLHVNDAAVHYDTAEIIKALEALKSIKK